MGDKPTWEELLREAVERPGLLLQAYRAFHHYSVGNQLLAMLQCTARGLEPGPLNTYGGWRALGRQVKQGERALSLVMPLTRRRRSTPQNDDREGSADDEDAEVYTHFISRPRWFVLAQTDGAPYQLPALAAWEKERSLQALGVCEEPFTATNGNIQGYAHGRTLAINPVAALPHKTLFHELGHITLGHTLETRLVEGEALPRSLCEAEAESVALLCLDALNLPGGAYCRGYIQSWLQGETIPERSAKRIFGATDRILKAGKAGHGG